MISNVRVHYKNPKGQRSSVSLPRWLADLVALRLVGAPASSPAGRRALAKKVQAVVDENHYRIDVSRWVQYDLARLVVQPELDNKLSELIAERVRARAN